MSGEIVISTPERCDCEPPLAGLPANSKLKWLNLGRMKGFKPDNFAHLARLKNLEGILLPNANPTAAEMAFLADLGKLRTISFEDNEVFTGEGFQGLKGFSSLTALDFDTCPLTDAGLEAIASAMPGLKSLIISREKNGKATFTPEGISTHLGRLRNLTHFKAGHSGFTDEWMPHIAQLKNVTDLSLIGAGITDAGLVHLKNLPLTELRLDQTGVTDAAVPILKIFPKLTNVNLGSANKLTDAGKAELQRFLDGNKGK